MTGWLTAADWGRRQNPPLSRHYVWELAVGERLEAPNGTRPMKPGREWLIPADAAVLPPTEVARKRWRERSRRQRELRKERE